MKILIENFLYFLYYACVLIFGIILSFAFSDISLKRKNVLVMILLFIVCGLSQIIAYILFAEEFVWKIYPLLVHLPLILVLWFFYKKRMLTVLASITTGYMCCQLPRWFGIFIEAITGNKLAGAILQLIVIIAAAYILVRFFACYVAEIFSKETTSVLIFSGIPIIYYLFDYSVSVYSIPAVQNLAAAEFMPFFLCVVYFLFCIIYYKEVEEKAMAVQKEHIIHMALEQQKKELESISKSEKEVRILRHDMRHYLDIISIALAESNTDAASNIIENLKTSIDNTIVQRYCSNTILNYVLSSYAAKCEEYDITFKISVTFEKDPKDDLLLASILSNALENAVQAVSLVDEESRFIELMMTTSGSKLLVLVKNSFLYKPLIVDGMPSSRKRGHGYGTQSIRFLTERAGGNCHYSIQNNYFILRIII